MLGLLRQRDFVLLWSGQLLSNLGNWLLILAVPVVVFELTGSVTGSSAAVLATTAPALLVGPLAGVAADRWNRRTIVLLSDVLRAVVVLALLLVDGPGDLWLLYATVFVESCVSQLFLPAHRALLPGLVGRGPQLSTANALYSAAGGVVRLAGGPLGGALYLLVGFDALVLIDAGTYAASALLLLGVRYRGAPRATAAAGCGTVWRDLVEGVATLRHNGTLRRLLASSSVFLLGNGMLTVMLVPYAYRRLHGDAGLVGVLFSALGAGFLVGAPLARRLADARAPHLALTAALAAATAAFAGLFNWPERAAAVAFICAVGVTGGAVLTMVQTLVQRYTPDPLLGRVSAAYVSVEMLATVTGAAAGGLVTAAFGLTVAANAAVALVAVSAGLARSVPAPTGSSTAA